MRKIKRLLILIILLLSIFSCKSVVTVKNPVYEFNQVYKTSSGSVWQQGDRINIIVGDSIQLGIKNINKEAIIIPKWAIQNSNIGVIDVNGIFIATKQGETIVTGKFGDTIVKTYYITVSEPQLSILPITQSPSPTPASIHLPETNSSTPTPIFEPLPNPTISNSCPASIEIIPASLSLCQQNTNNLRAFVRDCNGNDLNNAQVRWESVNTSVARVNNSGEVIGLDIGRTGIKASYNGISSEAQIEVCNCESGRCIPGWNYKKPITITNAGEALTDYQIKVSIDNSDAKFWNNVRNDGKDIRFIDETTCNELNYWLEDFNYGNTANLWFKIPNLPVGTKTIHLYYANSSATSNSTFDNTFTKNYEKTGLVGLWHMDENGDKGDVTDSSGNGNHGKNESHKGTLNNFDWTALSGWTNGKFGNALIFDGVNDYVNCGNSSSLNPSEVSVEFWYKVDTNPASAQYIVDKMIADPKGPYGIYWQAGTLRAAFTNNLSVRIVMDAGSPVAGIWHHVVSTYKNGEAKFYVDNEIKATNNVFVAPLKTDVEALSKPLLIGHGVERDYYFNGIIDNVRIYNKALTPIEVADRYTINKNIRDGLAAEYRFEENGGNNAYSSHLWQNEDGGQWDSRNDVKFSTGSNLKFDGLDDYMEVPDSPGLDISSAITLEGWVYLNTRAGYTYKTIIRKPPPAHADPWAMYGINFNATNEKLAFILTTGAVGSLKEVQSTSIIPLQTWTHVAGTWDGFDMKMYINGILENTNPAFNGQTIGTNNLPVYIGRPNMNITNHFFDGILDEIRIYDRALTQTEILTQYERRKYTLTPPTLNIGQGIAR